MHRLVYGEAKGEVGGKAPGSASTTSRATSSTAAHGALEDHAFKMANTAEGIHSKQTHHTMTLSLGTSNFFLA